MLFTEIIGYSSSVLLGSFPGGLMLFCRQESQIHSVLLWENTILRVILSPVQLK